MPEISRFFGIIITMNYNDHAPPHFHARYGDEKAIVAIPTLILLRAACRRVRLGWSSSGQRFIKRNCWKTGNWPGNKRR